MLTVRLGPRPTFCEVTEHTADTFRVRCSVRTFRRAGHGPIAEGTATCRACVRDRAAERKRWMATMAAAANDRLETMAVWHGEETA